MIKFGRVSVEAVEGICLHFSFKVGCTHLLPAPIITKNN